MDIEQGPSIGLGLDRDLVLSLNDDHLLLELFDVVEDLTWVELFRVADRVEHGLGRVDESLDVDREMVHFLLLEEFTEEGSTCDEGLVVVSKLDPLLLVFE